MKNFHINNIGEMIRKHYGFLLLCALLIGMSLILYSEYVFSGRLFVFEDFGSDSIRVAVPTYLYFFDWFTHGMPWWSDKMGLGTSVLSHGDVIFDPFTYVLFIFGQRGIMYLFVHMIILKIIASGIFFWLFLGKYKVSLYAKLLGSLTYAFGGYMIVVGQNYVFGTIYVYMPLIFLGFEMWLQDKKNWLLILMLTATALYFYYFFYMTAIFFGVYAMFRYIAFFNFSIKHFLKYIFSLIGYGLLSLGLSAFFWLPSLALTLTNLRIGAASPSVDKMFFPDIFVLTTAVGRLFGYDVFGGPKEYLGYANDYFQLAFFSGIFTLVLAPQIFSEKNAKKKKAYIVFAFSLLFLLAIPFFAYVFNGFSDFTYRWTYIFHFSLSLFLAIAATNVFEKRIYNAQILRRTLVVLASTPFFVLLFLLNTGQMDAVLRSIKIFFVDYILILIYVILIILFFRTRYKQIIKILLLLLVCFELLWFPRHFIHDRITTYPDPVKNNLGYFDNTNKAVDYLTKFDPSIYRIDKSYDSVVSEYGNTPSDNDAMAQGYRGLKSYNANNQPNYIRFLQNADIFVKYPKFYPPSSMKPHDLKDENLNYINGVGDRFLLQSFLGVKYYLAKDGVIVPAYYHPLKKIGDITVFSNTNYLPLGFTLDSFILRDEFKKLSPQAKDVALLSHVVVDTAEILPGNIYHSTKIPPNQDEVALVVQERRNKSLHITSYRGDDIQGRIKTSKNKVLVFSIPYDLGWHAYLDSTKVNLLKVDNGLIGLMLPPGSHTIRLQYIPQKMYMGIVISISSILLYLLYLVFQKSIVRLLHSGKKSSIVLYDTYARLPVETIIKLTIAPFYNYTNSLITEIKEKNKQLSINKKKYIFYLSAIGAIIMFFINALITRGSSFYNLLNPDRKDYFMDFYNTLYSLYNGPYTYGSIYPPLPHLFYRLLLRLVPFDIAKQGAFVIRESQSGEIVFFFYMLLTLGLFFILLMEIKKGLRLEKYIFMFVMLFSAPFLHEFERANIIFVALLFLMFFVFFKDSKRRGVRELSIISLALSVGIKLYPAVFILILLKEKRTKEAWKAGIYSLAFCILPFFALGGISQLLVFLRNLAFTTNDSTSWGLGYAVNIQNIIRILFAYVGQFGTIPIIIGNFFSFVILIFGLIASYFSRSMWKTVAILTLLMILIPAISYEYTLIFMIIPLLMFLDNEKKERFDYLYIICFLLLFAPFTFEKIHMINHHFRWGSKLPLTYGVLIQNIAIAVMSIFLIAQGLAALGIQKIKNIVRKISFLCINAEKFYWIVPVFVILVYNLTFLNRFYPITEGWFSSYAWLMHHGQFPYKDFYFFLTPLFLIKMSIFTSIFGYQIIYLRLLGLVVILLMTYFLYKNIEFFSKASIAAFVAIVGMIYYQSGTAHITYDFIQFFTLYSLIQSYFLLKYITYSKLSMRWLVLAGIFAALAFLTKQSNGMMITIFSFAGLLVLSLPKGIRDILKIVLAYGIGFIIPVSLIMVWLLLNSAFLPFSQQVFSGAVSAKGGLDQIFFSWIKGLLTYNFIVRFKEILMVVFAFGYWIYFFIHGKKENENFNKILMLVSCLAVLICIIAPLVIHSSRLHLLGYLGEMGINNIIVAAISLPLILVMTACFCFIFKKPFNKSILLFSFVALGFIYGTGTSAGISEAGAFAGFCLIVALLIQYKSIFGLGKIFIIFFCISFSFMLINIKYERPYLWWNTTSPDIRSRLYSTDKIAILQGIYTSASNIKILEEITSEIRSGSQPGEPILTFPNIPIFYLLAERNPPGKTIVHWFDFLPDTLALKEAEAIRKNPPKVIVYLDLGPSVWEAHERLFRGGRLSGQRKIDQVIQEIIRNKKMHGVKKYKLSKYAILTVWK